MMDDELAKKTDPGEERVQRTPDNWRPDDPDTDMSTGLPSSTARPGERPPVEAPPGKQVSGSPPGPGTRTAGS
jgi:hypothetical protein